MQAMILAAGRGKRLGGYTQNCTKCMVEVAGRPLILRAIDSLKWAGIEKLVIVIGYQGSKLRELLGDQQDGLQIEYVTNSAYAETNNIFSLFLARHYLLEDDTLLLESDVIFESGLLSQVVADARPNLAVVDKYQPWMDGTVVTLNGNNQSTIKHFVPRQQLDEANLKDYFKTVNIYKFSQEFSRTTYVPFLEAFSSAMGRNEYYEQVLKVIASLDTGCLHAFQLNGQKWYEIDDPVDKENAETMFASEVPLDMDSVATSFGGFWRYPELTDYRYLVNPYFPTPELLEELHEAAPQLLTQYPSGQQEQQQLASRLFGLRPEQVVVGNGASELIRGLAANLTGSVGIVFPTFNEYPERFGDRVVRWRADADDDFSYGLENLLRLASRCDNLLLVNPDNPSGHFIDRADLIPLAERLSGMGCRLIIDESFVDFTAGGASQSLLEEELLDAFPELIVIKSLGKSYGVPGARLGILATSDRQVANSMRRYLPIWNVGSLGEYFLQIADRYQADYAAACQQLGFERDWLTDRLGEISFLRPLRSAANFICCQLTSSYTATELTESLLNSRQILIKDLSTKPAMQKHEFIRLAVRNRPDNRRLMAALSELDRRQVFDDASPTIFREPATSSAASCHSFQK